MPDFKKRHAQAGLTLMEILIAVTLLSLVVGSFAYLYGTAQRFMIQSMNIDSTQEEASFAMEHIHRNLQLASMVALPANVGEAGAVLEFTWRAAINAPEATSRYTLVGTNLRFIPNTAIPGAFIVVARNIAGVTFTRVLMDSIAIEVRSQRTLAGDVRQITLRTTVNPRGLF